MHADVVHPTQSRGIVTMVMLTAGTVFLPVIGALVGLAMLWESRLWTLREKLLGTLLPFEVGAFVLMLFLPASRTRPGAPSLLWHGAIALLVLAAMLYTLYRLVVYRRFAQT